MVIGKVPGSRNKKITKTVSQENEKELQWIIPIDFTKENEIQLPHRAKDRSKLILSLRV